MVQRDSATILEAGSSSPLAPLTCNSPVSAPAIGWRPKITAFTVGCVVALVMSAVAGLVVARLAPSHRTFRVLVAAAGVALVGYLLHLYVAARSVGGLSALLSVGELRALYVSLALALVLGMRFAFSPGTSADRH